MRLPVEQYNELDPEMITSLGGNRFRLQVPRLAILSVWVQPAVEIVVMQEEAPPRVVLRAEGCRLDGSAQVKKMELDRRFELHFSTVLTWGCAPPPPAAAGSAGSRPGGSNGSLAAVAAANVVHADLQLEVLTEIIPPFTSLPRSLLEHVVNTLLRGLMRSLLPLFVKRLAEDYQRWAASPEYRARRAAGGAGAPPTAAGPFK
jgi:hypothetical protein